jgi:hypothetical protein
MGDCIPFAKKEKGVKPEAIINRIAKEIKTKKKFFFIRVFFVFRKNNLKFYYKL